jgi:hypothetical protein
MNPEDSYGALPAFRAGVKEPFGI